MGVAQSAGLLMAQVNLCMLDGHPSDQDALDIKLDLEFAVTREVRVRSGLLEILDDLHAPLIGQLFWGGEYHRDLAHLHMRMASSDTCT